MFTKPFRVSLKLKEGKAPHLYLVQLQSIMDEDTSLHPMMEKTLKLLKKTKTPYIVLAKLREVVIDPINFRHFDRSADPKGPWLCTLWSKEEIAQHKKDSQNHIKAVFDLFNKLGYDFYDSQPCNPDYMQMLEGLTEGQVQAQLQQREDME